MSASERAKEGWVASKKVVATFVAAIVIIGVVLARFAGPFELNLIGLALCLGGFALGWALGLFNKKPRKETPGDN